MPWPIANIVGYAHKFRYLPLFFLTGPSGAGKSTVGLMLQQTFPEVVVIDKDIFWMDVFNDPDLNYRDSYDDFVLRACKNISQYGKPVLLVGTSLPQHLKSNLEKRYFSALHFFSPDSQSLKNCADVWKPGQPGGGLMKTPLKNTFSFNQWFWGQRKSGHSLT